MSVEIKSGASSDIATVDPTSKAMRVTIYNAAGVDQSEHTELGLVSCATFRTLGNAASPQNIFTIENLSGSGRLVYIQAIQLQVDTTAALLTVSCQADVSRTTAIPSGGTALNKHLMDTTLNSHANIIARGATASDGGVATAITATAAAGYVNRVFISRQATAVGLIAFPIVDLLPQGVLEGDTLLLRENQAIVVQITGTAASNAATNHYILSAFWHEA